MGQASQTRTPETQLFRDIFNASSIGIAVENLDGQPLFVNPAFCSFLGFSEEELRNKHCVDFSPAEDAEKDWELFQQLKGGSLDHYQLEKRYFRKDGSLVWGSLSISLLNSRPSPMVIAMVEDITDKKKGEEALHESEERLRLAVQAGKMFAYSWDAATDVIERSGQSAEILGVKNEEAATGAAVSAMVHPDDKQRLEAALAKLMIQAPTLQITYRIIRPDGIVKWLERNSRAHFGQDGKIKRIVGMIVDVTERKLAEHELSKANERLHLAIESGSVGGWDYDLKTGKDVWFGNAHTQLGVTPDETSGSRKEFWDHVHQDDRDRLKRTMLVAKDQHEAFTEEFRVVWRDGTIHWLRSRGQYYYGANGEPERMLGISVEITENKKSEQALRDGEERFHLAEQVGNMFSFDWDVTTDVVVRSPGHVRILGLVEPTGPSRQALIEKIHPDDQQKLAEMLRRLSPQNSIGHLTYRMQIGGGALRWLKSSGRAFFDTQGKMVRVIGTVVDITDLKKAEEAVADMTRKLIESQEQERTRIGRKLHDDINQRLAMFGVELEQLLENPSELPTRVRELRKQMAELSGDEQALSHDLHSSKLEYLGVVAGMKSWCKEFAERQKIELDCKTAVSSPLPPEIGLSLLPRIRKMSGYREPIDCRVFVNAGSKYSVKKSDWSQFPPHRDNPNFGRMSPPSNTESGHSRMMEEMSFSYRSLCPCKSVAKKQVDTF